MFQKRGETSCPPTLCIGRGVVVMVTYVTLSDLLTFCLVIIGVMSLVIQASNKKK